MDQTSPSKLTTEIRESSEAETWVLAGLMIATTPTAREPGQVARLLRWVFELANLGEPILPPGAIVDFGVHLLADGPLSATTANAKATSSTTVNLRQDSSSTPIYDSGLQRRYEDYVLGRLVADTHVERAVDALALYPESDRDRGLAFAINSIRSRIGYAGTLISPAAIKHLIGLPEEALARRLRPDSFDPAVLASLVECTENLIQCFRFTAALLGPEDVFELERRTAISEFGQRLALRQVFAATTQLEHGFPRHKPKSKNYLAPVRANLTDEDNYPVGGFSSISNKGSIESLLRSELAYIDDDHRPDIFDVRYVRDELLYYARDENQFFRQRMTFVITLEDSLAVARHKDADLDWQRIIYVLACVQLSIKTLGDWLGEHALQFIVTFPPSNVDGDLADEFDLLQVFFQEEINQQLVHVTRVEPGNVTQMIDEQRRVSQCHWLHVAAETTSFHTNLDDPGYWPLLVEDAYPKASWFEPAEGATPKQQWQAMIRQLLSDWV